MSCTTTWEHEKIPGGGWTYNEPGMTYDSELFDTLIPYYDSLGEATQWTLGDEIADFDAEWLFEHRNAEACLYDEVGITYDEDLYDGFVVYYNQLGQPTSWSFEEFIEGCAPVFLLFMDGSDYSFQDGELKELN